MPPPLGSRGAILEAKSLVLMQKSPKLRQARFDDYPQIAALAAKFELTVENYSAWTHLWTNNPAYREIKGEFPMGWILESDSDGIVGYLGNIPMAYELRGQRLMAATTRAWVVDKPYRAYSPMLLATYFQQKNVDLFLSTTVNSQSEAAYSSFQSSRVPVGAWDRALFWITNYPGFVASYLRRKRGELAEVASYPLAAGLFALDRIRGARLPRPSTAIQVVSSAGFDERFQPFWDSLRKVKANTLIADRSPEVLDWHFKFALQTQSAWIYVAENGLGLMAYSIFLRYDYPQAGLTRVRLVDFQCLEPNKASDVLFNMLRAAIQRCCKESIHMCELVGVAPELKTALQHTSARERTLGSWLYFYKTNITSLARELNDPTAWEPSLFDGDSSL